MKNNLARSKPIRTRDPERTKGQILEAALNEFVEERLADFGPYEDAMATDVLSVSQSSLVVFE